MQFFKNLLSIKKSTKSSRDNVVPTSILQQNSRSKKSSKEFLTATAIKIEKQLGIRNSTEFLIFNCKV